MENIYLPAITGQFSNWRYYQLIMPVKNIVQILGYTEKAQPIYRIRTVDEVNEIYSSSINDMLQRVFDVNRLEPIKNYLLKQQDKYANNLTVAIFGGEPEWLPIGLKNNAIESLDDEDKFDEIAKAFGVIKLSGEEVLFVLDGQHRVKGLREAVKEDEGLLGQEIAITLVSHESTTIGKEKTRRLFTTINRYAKPVSIGESILLDEDDLSAIIVRKLIEEYPKFKGKNIIALNKEANLTLPRDAEKFSTTIELWTINESLIDNKAIYPEYDGPKKNLVRVRPSDEIVKRDTKKIFSYWNLFFKTFPNAEKFISDPKNNLRGKIEPFSLRPVGQTLFIKFYLKILQSNEGSLADIKKIPDDLKNEFWHFVLWNPIDGTITGTESYARSYVYYHLGYDLTQTQIDKLLVNYKKYKNDDRAKLPLRKFAK